MSPFHDLGFRYGSPLPAERVPTLPSSGSTPVGAPPGANTELRIIPLPRLVGLLSLGVLGLVTLLSLGVGGVVLVQDHLFPASKVGTRDLTGASRHAETSSLRTVVRRKSGAVAGTSVGDPPAEVLGNRARELRWVAHSGPAPRRSGSISRNQPETPETAYVETTTVP